MLSVRECGAAPLPVRVVARLARGGVISHPLPQATYRGPRQRPRVLLRRDHHISISSMFQLGTILHHDQPIQKHVWRLHVDYGSKTGQDLSDESRARRIVQHYSVPRKASVRPNNGRATYQVVALQPRARGLHGAGGARRHVVRALPHVHAQT